MHAKRAKTIIFAVYVILALSTGMILTRMRCDYGAVERRDRSSVVVLCIRVTY